METANKKAEMVAARFISDTEGKLGKTPEFIIGADTIVVQDGVIFGKPHNEEKGREMLRM